MAKKTKDSNLSLEERLEQALIPNWDEPYKLPENWCWVRVDAIASIYTGNSINERVKEEKYTGRTDGLVYLATKDIDFDSTIDYDTNVCIPQSEGFKVAPKYSILLCIEGGSAGRKIGFITQDVCFVNKLCAFVPHGRINPKYLYYAIQSDAFKKQFDAKKHGLIGGVSVKEVSSIFIPFAPIEIQNKIVELIESIFNKLHEAKEKSQEVVEGYKFRKESILYNAFQGKLTVSLNDNDIQCGWTELTLGELILGGPQNGLYKSQNAYGQGTKILRIDGFYDGWLEPWDTLKRLTVSDEEIKLYGLNINDIVINRVNSMAYLGKSALIRNLPETCVYESNMMRISLDTSKIVPEYLIYYLNSSLGLEELRKNAKQAVNQASINQQDVKSVSVPVPSIYEQQKIVDILDNLLSKEKRSKETAEAVIEQIDTMKKAILARAFRGELGTNDPSEESALELLKSVLMGNTNQQEPQKSSKKSISIPNHIETALLTKLEKKIVSLFYTTERKVVSVDEIMSVSSKKIDIIDTLTKLEQRGILIRLNNSCYRIKE